MRAVCVKATKIPVNVRDFVPKQAGAMLAELALREQLCDGI